MKCRELINNLFLNSNGLISSHRINNNRSSILKIKINIKSRDQLLVKINNSKISWGKSRILGKSRKSYLQLYSLILLLNRPIKFGQMLLHKKLSSRRTTRYHKRHSDHNKSQPIKRINNIMWIKMLRLLIKLTPDHNSATFQISIDNLK